MGTFARSWELTKLSFRVIGEDKELLLFPIIGGIASLLYTVAIVVPSVLLVSPEQRDQLGELLYYGATFVLYFGLAFIATFFNTCVVYTTKVRFEGGNATFFESLAFALSRLHLIVAWSAVSATVGLLLRILERAAERAGLVGKIVFGLVSAIVGLAWSVTTIFVVPAMVYRGLGPIDAIRHSVGVLKKTWGESLIRHYGLGFAQFVFVLLGILVFGGGAFALASTGAAFPVEVWWAVGGAAAVYFVGLAAVFTLANAIFNTALFVFADTGRLPQGYSQDVMRDALRRR